MGTSAYLYFAEKKFIFRNKMIDILESFHKGDNTFSVVKDLQIVKCNDSDKELILTTCLFFIVNKTILKK